MDTCIKLNDTVNICLIPKLTTIYEENKEHLEFEIRNKNLNTNFQYLVENLNKLTKTDFHNNPAIVAYLLILYKELSCEISWNKSLAKNISAQLNTFFEIISGVSLDSVLCTNDVLDSQEVFDKCFEELHSKLKLDTFKYYPGQIEVYCNILEELPRYDLNITPSKVFPITLLLIGDYIPANRKKGLKCCSILLKSLKPQDFRNGNYYEVIYQSLKNSLSEKDIELMKLIHSNLLELIRILPDHEKKVKLDDIYANSLDQLSMESNLYKKAEFFNFIVTLITRHKENCCNRSTFKDIICQNLDICTNEAVIQIILEPLIQCLKSWIIYCWPVWRYSSDHKMLSKLFKVLYACTDDCLTQELHKIIVTLSSLCTSDEKSQIIMCLERLDEIKSKTFEEKLQRIKADL